MGKKVIFDKKNVLVTGGAGFIGSHLCDELVKTCKVICLDNFSTGQEKNIDHLLAEPVFEFVKHDLTEPIDLEKLPELQKFKIEFQGIQEIYHLACPTSPVNFEKNRIPTVLANSYAVKNVLDIARKYKAKFLHFSSSVVYGRRKGDKQFIREDNLGEVDFLSPRSSYDEGKRFAETMVGNYQREYNIDAKIMRLFRVYGPRMRLNDGQMLPDFISNCLDNKDVEIYGDENFSTTYCYISDCVDAAVKLMDADQKEPVNIGSDVLVNLTELARKVIKMIGADSRIKYNNDLLFMTPLPLPDISRARNTLNWMPVITLEQGLERTIYELRATKGLKGVEQALSAPEDGGGKDDENGEEGQ